MVSIPGGASVCVFWGGIHRPFSLPSPFPLPNSLDFIRSFAHCSILQPGAVSRILAFLFTFIFCFFFFPPSTLPTRSPRSVNSLRTHFVSEKKKGTNTHRRQVPILVERGFWGFVEDFSCYKRERAPHRKPANKRLGPHAATKTLEIRD